MDQTNINWYSLEFYNNELRESIQKHFEALVVLSYMFYTDLCKLVILQTHGI